MKQYFFPRLYTKAQSINPDFWLDLQSEIERNNVKHEQELFEFFYNGVMYEQKDFVKFLIERGENINVRIQSNAFPIHWARSVEMAKLLIDNGANVNECCNCYYLRGTPLEISATCGNKDLVKYYLLNGHENGNFSEGFMEILKVENKIFWKEEFEILSIWKLLKLLYILEKVNPCFDAETIYLLSENLLI